MVDKVIATSAALELVAFLQTKHGPDLMFHQSGGCCDNKNVDAPQQGNLLGRSQTMATLLGYTNRPSMLGGWAGAGQQSQSYHCVSSGIPSFYGDVQTASWSRISGGDLDVYATRVRELSCPADYTLRLNANNQPECWAEPCYDCEAEDGNPINFLTGEKKQSESDFIGTGDGLLALQRHYSSQGAYRPKGAPETLPSGFGDTWRTVYHTRVYPLTGVNVMAARVSAKQRWNGSAPPGPASLRSSKKMPPMPRGSLRCLRKKYSSHHFL